MAKESDKPIRPVYGMVHPNYTPDEEEFLKAIDYYKRTRRRPFPTWREVLAIAVSLGYRKVANPEPMPSFVKGNEVLGDDETRTTPKID